VFIVVIVYLLSTQSGNFWIHSRTDFVEVYTFENFPVWSLFIEIRGTESNCVRVLCGA